MYFRGEDEITRDRMESCRSDNERRNRAASVSDASVPFDQRSKSRNSSSSSQETNTPASNTTSRGHSAHASTSSPGSSRRNTVTSTGDKPQLSPSFERDQRTARSLTGSLSSPVSSSHRPSKGISTAHAIAHAASTASTPMFQQPGGSNSASQQASSTVINVTGEQRKQSSASTIGNTHIIKVSGPVTNLDETVLSAVGMEGSLIASTISEHSTTSTASVSSSTAPVGETREVSSSPISLNISLPVSYNIGYGSSSDKQSLTSSNPSHSANDYITDDNTEDNVEEHRVNFVSNSISKNLLISHDNISDSSISKSPTPVPIMPEVSSVHADKDLAKDGI